MARIRRCHGAFGNGAHVNRFRARFDFRRLGFEFAGLPLQRRHSMPMRHGRTPRTGEFIAIDAGVESLLRSRRIARDPSTSCGPALLRRLGKRAGAKRFVFRAGKNREISALQTIPRRVTRRDGTSQTTVRFWFFSVPRSSSYRNRFGRPH